jgi:stage V sporulation protein AE
MIFIYAFLIGGIICALAQLVLDIFELTPGVITAIFVMLGALLEFFDIYDYLIKFSEAGALLPITSFGHSLMHGAMEATKEYGIFGIAMGMFDLTAAGITAAILFGFLTAIIFKSKS